ncbi:hypothetical protein AA11826_2013 [Komagataeibacter oboediens DSM 11826]|nr:hypothetical protein AA11826_2013 [Komagataeibacter oboediens DSM 11826]
MLSCLLFYRHGQGARNPSGPESQLYIPLDTVDMGDKYGRAGRGAKSHGPDRVMAVIESRCVTRIPSVTAGQVT